MRAVWCLVLVLAVALSAHGDLQNVNVGGEMRIRYRTNANYQITPPGPGPGGSVARLPLFLGNRRPIGATGFQSRYQFDDRGRNRNYGEMVARIHADADFTDNVSARIEFESYNRYGEDFRSNWATGADARGGGDVDLMQAYFAVEELCGLPLTLRVGRQTMLMGKGWLVGAYTTGLISLPFDAVRLTYERDALTVDAWAAKLAELSPGEQDGDTDFYGIYGTYTGIERLNLSAYYLLLRDAAAINDTTLGPAGEWVEALLGLDDYEPTYLHTIGLRAWGECSQWDYDWEFAYQFGEADQIGSRFPLGAGTYGDTSANFGNFATDLELGYTFDAHWQPRFYLGGAIYQGEDNRDISVWQWLNPLSRPQASVSFNRLFANTNQKYTFILDSGQLLTNFIDLRAGIQVKATEKIDLGFEIEKFLVYEPFDVPWMARIGHARIPLAPGLSFLTREADDDLGIHTTLTANYQYSDDLWFKFIWEHLFLGDGIWDGNFVDRNGLYYLAGGDEDDADYIALMMGLKF